MNIKKLIDAFEQCVRCDEMKGGGDPEDWAAVEQDLTKAREDLLQVIGELQQQLNIEKKLNCLGKIARQTPHYIFIK